MEYSGYWENNHMFSEEVKRGYRWSIGKEEGLKRRGWVEQWGPTSEPNLTTGDWNERKRTQMRTVECRKAL